ncbi:hypothetical protein HC031_16205 [Planosporangium thailandense]|uniref:Uncharacterized protein n=1 Tax=Planosporangium thailandense TaxID=765197 RepID=A0ABX0Y1B8_9ACTN|nr:DUF5701 family protein [Planosporangium thailandense]NJC71244.1 hypothetical protein [Planosporangium thailandense]
MEHWTDREFDRQLANLFDKGYPRLAGESEAEFAALLEPLREVARTATVRADPQPTPARVPFVVVVTESLVPAEKLVPLLTLAGSTTHGVVDRNHGTGGLAPYRPLPELGAPQKPAYLLVDVERGEEFRNVRPEDALPVILGRDRTPLTIAEGIALITHFPEVLEKNHCFMLSGSRRGDRRVPALWISGRAPKLGWCWDGNPHAWLGTASAGARAA